MVHEVIHWEIGGRDLEGLDSFYRTLFGWETAGFDPNYRLVTSQTGVGGGLMRCHGDMTPYVTLYVSVDDLDATLATVKDLGGTILVPPTPIAGVGAFALFGDPEGNAIGIMKMQT